MIIGQIRTVRGAVRNADVVSRLCAFLNCLALAVILHCVLALPSLAVPNPPSISPSYRVFSTSPQQVTMATDPGNQIWYRTDGQDPTPGGPGSTQYTGPFNISSGVTTIKAISYDGVSSSTVTTTQDQIDTRTANVPSSGLVLWFKSDLGVLPLNGSSVQSWQDASGNGNTASQGTGSNQPVFVPNTMTSGLGAVKFDGADDFLSIPSGLATFNSGISCFLVTKILPPTVNNGGFFDFGNAGTDDLILVEGPDTTQPIIFRVYNGTNIQGIHIGGDFSTNGQYQMVEVRNNGSGTGQMWWNGATYGSTSQHAANAVTRNSNFIGKLYNNTYFKGHIVEMLVYSRAVSDTERENIEKYLQSRFPPTITPQSGVYSVDVRGSKTIYIGKLANTTVKFTTDYSSPVTSGTARTYVAPFTSSESIAVRAYASIPGVGDSPISNSFICLDGNTISIPQSGLNLWVREFGKILSNNKVELWGDLSQQCNDLKQSVTNNQPGVALDADVGKEVVSFNGSTQSLDIGPSFTSNLTSGATIAVLTKPGTISTGQRFIDLGNGTGSDNLYFSESAPSGVSLFAFSGSTSSNVTSSSGLTADRYQLLEGIHDGAGAAKVLTNGSQTASGSVQNLANILRTGNFVGRDFSGGNLLNGNIGELMVWNRGLTSSEQAAVESYLVQKFQVLNQVPPPPVINLATGTLAAPTQAVISSLDGMTIRMTTDGTTPGPSSPIFDGNPVPINHSMTLKAIAISPNGVQSTVASATYTLDATKFPAPDAGDSTTLNVNLHLPTTGSPQ